MEVHLAVEPPPSVPAGPTGRLPERPSLRCLDGQEPDGVPVSVPPVGRDSKL